MSLDKDRLGRIHEVLLRSFDRDELRIMLRLQLGEDLDTVAGDDDLRTVVFNLVTWAERTSRTEELVAGALAANPGNPELRQLAEEPETAPTAERLTAPEPRAGKNRGRRAGLLLGVGAAALVGVLFFMALRPLFAPAPPATPAPTRLAPTEPALESPLATAPPFTQTPSVTPSPLPTALATERPTERPTELPTEAATDLPEPAATATAVEPPRAPALLGGLNYKTFTEESRLITVRSGKAVPLEMRDLWSAPEGTPADCANAFVLVSWQVRDPYPGGEELEIRRVIPRGGGRTEVLAIGARGREDLSYCDSIELRNLGLADYRLEWRFVSAVEN